MFGITVEVPVLVVKTSEIHSRAMCMQTVGNGGNWCTEDDEDIEVLLSHCMAKTTCTPPVHSKILKSCHPTTHSDFVQVEYRCIPG